MDKLNSTRSDFSITRYHIQMLYSHGLTFFKVYNFNFVYLKENSLFKPEYNPWNFSCSWTVSIIFLDHVWMTSQDIKNFRSSENATN